MPLKECSVDGSPGWKFGDSGKCYTYTEGDASSEKRAKKRAVQQAVAIGGGKAPPELSARDLAEGGMKTCKNCQMPRPTTRFPEDARTKDGLSSVCVQCRFGRQNAERQFADALETVDLDGVPILAAGGPYFGQGSPDEGDHFDEDYLRELAANNEALRGEVKAPIKIGHSSSQRLLKNSGLWTDEQPAAGWLENFRVAGGKLLADLKRVPKKLAALIESGQFRTRSVELAKVKAQTKDGKEFEVVNALSLLGAKAPAVRTLDDIVTQWYGEDDDHMEETVRLILADVENDTGNRTVDFADGQIVWDAENGSSDWMQDLSAALNANVSTGPNEMQQPYWVQDVDQINRKAIVCDNRTNAYWVVPFSIGSGSDNDDPVPAPFEQWTLAEQAFIRAKDAGTDSGGQNGAVVRDTSNMSEKDKPEAVKLSDEQVEQFAESFGIKEDDPEKRRDAVLAKFGEFTKTQETPPAPAPDPDPQNPQPNPTPPPSAADEGVTLSAAEKEKLLSDAEKSREFMAAAFSDRIDANLNAAARMGKIDPKDFPRWRSFMEKEYDLAVDQLAGLPINTALFRSYGSDITGDEESARSEQTYKTFADMAGLPYVEKKVTA